MEGVDSSLPDNLGRTITYSLKYDVFKFASFEISSDLITPAFLSPLFRLPASPVDSRSQYLTTWLTALDNYSCRWRSLLSCGSCPRMYIQFAPASFLCILLIVSCLQ